MWGATAASPSNQKERRYFNPRAPCGARPYFRMQDFFPSGFQSTRPVWGATASETAGNAYNEISIHAPRVGRDRVTRISCARSAYFNPRAPCGARRTAYPPRPDNPYFNPRAPCGARQYSLPSKRSRSVFQSTRPVWGATTHAVQQFSRRNISIHAPRVGRDEYGDAFVR